MSGDVEGMWMNVGWWLVLGFVENREEGRRIPPPKMDWFSRMDKFSRNRQRNGRIKGKLTFGWSLGYQCRYIPGILENALDFSI